MKRCGKQFLKEIHYFLDFSELKIEDLKSADKIRNPVTSKKKGENNEFK